MSASSKNSLVVALAVGLAAIVLPVQGAKAGVPCEGVAQSVAVSAAGNVHISVAGLAKDDVICNLNGTQAGISKETCLVMHNTMTAAVLSRRTVVMWFSRASCPVSIAPYNASNSWRLLHTDTAYGFYHFELK